MKLIYCVCVASLLFLTACSGGKPAPTGALAQRSATIPVAVGKAVRRPVPIEVRAIGNVQAYSTVSVKAEVSGELTGVHFIEGQDVRQGDLLFTIDPRPFEAALKQAEANRARDIAQAENAASEAQRYGELFRGGIVARQQYDQFRANAEALSSAVKADEAAIETARLQLGYTKIRSPIDGRTGNLLMHRGNLVKANDVPLVVINQVQPIYVAFSIPSQYLPEVKRYMAARALRVEATPKEGGRAAIGTLSFIDNTIDPSTATIQLKGAFPNTDRSLWPGEFVDVTLTLTVQGGVVVPSQAIQTGQQGQYVFVVRPDMTVESRPVVVNRAVAGETVIENGLRPGETVVTDGQLRLAPGARVSIVKGVGAS